MNVFDFDGTLYDGDCTIDFYKYCVTRYPYILKVIPRQTWAVALFAAKRISKTQFKEKFFSFLKYLPNPEQTVEDFWKTHLKKLKPEVVKFANEGDIVISASPEFLLDIPCKFIGTQLIGSRIDIKTGLTNGLNCWGEEKVCRLKEFDPDVYIENFYSDSHADDPLAKTASKSYFVKGDKVSEWPNL